MSERLAAWVDELGAIGGRPSGGVTRVAWSPELAEANAWLVARATELGMDAGVDPAGNVVCRWAGAEPDATAVVVGSHLDTVPDGGRYDGAFGVLAGLEVLRRLRERGFTPRRPVWLVAFDDEEGTRYDASMFGSHAFCGDDVGHFLDRADADGVVLRDAMRAAGSDPADLPRAAAVDRVGHYLELHIEQGPRMERAGHRVAVVSAIVGMAGYVVTLTGAANHAGTTPMDARADALAGAARALLALRDAIRAEEGMTVNVGRIEVEPGGANVIPGTARFTVDVRGPTAVAMERADELVRGCVEDAAEAEGLSADVAPTFQHPATDLDPELRALLARRVAAAGAEVVELVSGAGHDAMVLAAHVPAAMLFVPSRGGISHAPDEYTAPEHYEPALTVLTEAVAELAGRPG
ncbi:hydantoinase/carbamoylase family amidase [Geodermatophilus sp. SYSU D00815]